MTRPFKTIGIIGEGRMGTNLFHHIAGFGFTMRWLVSPSADLEKIRKSWAKKVSRGIAAGIIGKEEGLMMEQAVIDSDRAALHDCDLIIEAIPEDLEQKTALFAELEQALSPGCILTSNSSSILPSRLCKSPSMHTRMAGLHFFYPVSMRNMAEVVLPEGAHPSVADSLQEFLRSIGHMALLQREPHVFLLNRLFLEFQLEAWQIVSEGELTAVEVDRLIHDSFFPLGAFECFDAVGLDIITPSVRNYAALAQDSRKFESLLERLDGMVAAGKLGMKTGEGFFQYGEDESSADIVDRTPDPAVLATAEDRLRNALNQATGLFVRTSGCDREELEKAFRIFTGN